ncbi:exodeoxyribonuclease VII large subunit [Rhodobacter veldkampii DSM 11550]|uniref:Exodeoxyribonuclease 7 large subunit n=1 Tax=Phaeovulum veldkampii DSM 11550 TaxID=1185920 RepID=A0A2T4JKK2_9RHOB|nr:exodeoxyribonuclease VII large subunit [Phaeovulum veldkampii]MBK5946751.1 exodeoxyribonuclease VII large subunit [Phaeovulum veldkampii DSM 11550]PTE18414.1 exodeoxyribonuclease VII large subunit [Phaeovulum veldkampii DSM 11550]TDQ59292.1 exodeoxyribonuclease VII large subunit [Phaeovulum veldkampii DSM 11550]
MTDDLIEPLAGSGAGNAPEFTVSELSGAVKRVIEGEFARVRVRGEVGRVSRPASGHLYFDLKDDRSVLAAVSWKGQVARMQVRPEEGMEVIATGRLTTFPGQSKYQLLVDEVEPAGAGALMAMLEKRRQALAAEGLFDAVRKQPIPFLPGVIGVVTSPSGAVIRDILHRLRERFPRRVIVWPVAVQGQACAADVAAAIRGFNALAPGGPVPRPDLIIVARGGGSLEDLWGFNEEIVVRAAAASRIPLISAVGHETDTTLIDHAADLRAPTPTAAAELAVPVRLELLARTAEAGARLGRAVMTRAQMRRQRLVDLGRGLGRPQALLAPARQRFDLWADRLDPALRGLTVQKRARLSPLAALVRPDLLRRFMVEERRRLDAWSARLAPALARTRTDNARANLRNRAALVALAERLAAAPQARLAALSERLDRLDRMRLTLGYTETLRRGYAVVRGAGGLVSSASAAAAAAALEIEFHDGRLPVVPTVPDPVAAPPPASQGGARLRKPKPPRGGPDQGSLF